MSRWEDVKMRRFEGKKMRRWDEKMRWRCEIVRMWRWEDKKMKRYKEEKIFYRPPLLEESCAQILLGIIYIYIFFKKYIFSYIANIFINNKSIFPSNYFPNFLYLLYYFSEKKNIFIYYFFSYIYIYLFFLCFQKSIPRNFLINI
jgi:hypothetical protein